MDIQEKDELLFFAFACLLNLGNLSCRPKIRWFALRICYLTTMKPSKKTGLLSPPFSPPQCAQKDLPSIQQRAMPSFTIRPSIAQQLPQVLGEAVTGVDLLRTTNLYQVIRLRLLERRTVLVKAFIHYHSSRDAFTALIESCLQDAEDLALTLPYSHIRPLIEKHQWSLERVQQERLIILVPSSGPCQLNANESPINPTEVCMIVGNDIMAEILETWPAATSARSPPAQNGDVGSPEARNGCLTTPRTRNSLVVLLL